MHKLVVLIAAIGLVPSRALGQAADHLDRGDLSDFRQEAEHGELEGQETGAQTGAPAFTFSFGGMLLLDTNPAWASDGSPSALLAAPNAALTYSHPSLIPGWDLTLSASADADIFSRDSDDLNETRVNGGAMLFHNISNVGTLSLGVRARGVFIGQGFDHFDHWLGRYTIGFVPNISKSFSTSIIAEYRSSSDRDQRRFIGTVNLDLPLLDARNVKLDFFQEFAFSKFTAGDRQGRTDLLSLSDLALTPRLNLPDRVRLRISAILIHRFSNREGSRFTGFQVGPTLGFEF